MSLLKIEGGYLIKESYKYSLRVFQNKWNFK